MNKFRVLTISLVIIFSSALSAHAKTILNGTYINGPNCGYNCCFEIEVKNKSYRSQDTCNTPNMKGFSRWRSVSELNYVAKGVIKSPLKNSPQLCLKSLITKTRSSKTKTGYLDSEHSSCTTKGWIYSPRMAQ
jgi:hypothetical protein